MGGSTRSVAKRHHTVPRFYLRGFAQDDQLTSVRLPGDRRFTQSVGDASVGKHFYSLSGHPDGADVIEKALSKVEARTADVFAAIAGGTWPLSYDDRQVLGYFIALQAVRVPVHRRTVDYVARQVLRLHVRGGGKSGLRRDLEEPGPPLSDERVEKLWQQATRPECPPFRRAQAEHIGHMLETAQVLVPFIIGRPWSLVQFEQRSLITSDSPVALVPEPEAMIPGGGVGFMTAACITFPLTRKLGLLMSGPEPLIECGVPLERVHRGAADSKTAGTTLLERFFNLETVENASEWLFHHPQDARFVPDDLPDPTLVKMRVFSREHQLDGEP